MDIFMDCEDSNPWSWKVGDIGSSYVDKNRNLMLKMCIIDGAYFQQEAYAYGILQLTKILPRKWNTIIYHFDNEDSGNTNSLYYDGQRKSGQIGDNRFDHNTTLSFLYIEGDGHSNNFPELGIKYFVLGYFGNNKGSIYIDNEDNDNISYGITRSWRDGAWSYANYHAYPLNQIMYSDGNAKLYLSQAR